MDTNNYFSFFNLPEQFGLDEKQLKEKYYENSRKYHPDHFGQEEESKQAEMLELTTLNNNAYKTLKSFAKRVHYILDMHGLVTEGDKHTLSPDFLGEMMDVNELLMELEFDPDAEKLQQAEQQVDDWKTQLNSELQSLGNLYDNSNSEAEKQDLLQQIKEVYHKSKYILRLKESLSKFAAL